MKYSVKMKHLRLTSFLLCALILLLSCPITTIADDTTGAATTTAEQTQTEAATQSSLAGATLPDEVLGPGELPYEDLQALRVEDVARPETVTLAMAQEAQHVNRLDEQETNLHTVIFQNRGGNKTAYVYSQPVKYVTADGLVRDKDTAITESTLAGFAYAMTDNSITAHFAPTTSGGVVIEFAGHGMRMIPEGSTLVSTATRGDGDNEILYNNAFGARTVLRYQTQLNGVKEDIILLQNVGKYSFNFLLTTALTPVEANGTWVLTDEAGAVVMTLGEILVKDSAGKTAYGDLNITPRAQGGYIITVTAPEAFLTAPDTTYPVYIDPTVGASDYAMDAEWNEYETIIDVGLYKSRTDASNAAATETVHTLSTTGRVLYKFFDFYDTENGRFVNYKENTIGRVTMYINVGAGTAANINAKPLGVSWDTASPTLSDVSLWTATATAPIYSTTAIAAESGLYALDITTIVRGWARYNAGNSTSANDNPQNGFVLQISTGSRTVNATEGVSPDDVYYRIDYNIGGAYYTTNCYTNTYLAKASNSTALTSVNTTTANAIWVLDYVGDGTHLIYSKADPAYYLYSDATLQAPAGTNIFNYADGFYWEVASHPQAGGVTFKNCATGQVLSYDGTTLSMVNEIAYGDADFSKTNWLLPAQATWVDVTSFSVSNVETLAVGEGSYTALTVTPSNATYQSLNHFTWTSNAPNVAQVNELGYVTGIGDGIATITATHKTTKLKRSFTVQVGTLIEDGYYYIKSAATNRYLSMVQTTTNTRPIVGTTPDDPKSAIWWISYAGNGFYVIYSTYSNLFLRPASTSANANVIQTSPGSELIHWRILPTAQGNYKITCYSATNNGYSNLALSVQSSLSLNTRLSAYGNSSAYMPLCDWNIEATPYGSQEFRELDEEQYDDINCHGYAMMRNDKPSGWFSAANTYLSTLSQEDIDTGNYNGTAFAKAVKADFEAWLTEEGYTWEYESAFSGNGEYRTLTSNQYRIVLRTGIHNVLVEHEEDLYLYKLQFDYHFWYQTFDGRWANKHGWTETSAPELLPIGTTPNTQNSSGWALDFIIDNQVHTCQNFYDSPYYCYIITLP